MLQSINSNLKIVGTVIIVIFLWQSYMIYELKSDVKYQGVLVKEDPFVRTLLTSPTIQKVNPFIEFQIMQREFDKAFSRFNSIFANDSFFKAEFDDFFYKPLLDVSVDNDKYIIKTDIPGVKESDIEIKTDGGILIIQAKVDEYKENNASNFISRERFVNKFQRSVSLAQDADTSNIKKEYKDVVLTVTIPKKK